MPLSVLTADQPFQTQYAAPIGEMIKFFRASIGDNLHSLYLYGSVARCHAKPGYSNLDVIIVTKQPFEDNRVTLVNTLRYRYQRRYPFITNINIKTGLAKDIASLDSLFSWGFLLRHCAVCVYGDDLGECFGDYEPSWEIAKYWNMDVGYKVAYYRAKIAKAQRGDEQIRAQMEVGKKLLRASYSLVMYRDKQWFDDPVECGKQFLRYFPEKEKEIERLGILLKGKIIPKRSVVGLLDSFGPWLAKQYEKTEFRIG
ncbi:nucleotidyltransferase domain-containing protein [Vibrio sp. CAIM 722]|uniref:Nucleotidyltransferase domain-containing protein n=1 Tax=Vibrio eleionomae TaxID=2653505 RepID=A0A7X4LKZ0_9VIBR|nr:nucleotidyltransferase domain-containing protein [Vibrio eleionomae]MZI93710.1 nucleotidyltransferase domain-containing protein [Vibrio eleionomae]